MKSQIVAAIESRVSANLFAVDEVLQDAQIRELVRLATRAPTAYNLQNWRFIAVTRPQAKALLKSAAHGQAKVAEAAVTYIVCGKLPSHSVLEDNLQPSIDAGFMSPDMVGGWVQAVERTYGNNPQRQRDEAVRTATLGAAFLMFAAEAYGFVSGPMVGFDASAVAHDFDLAADEIPVMLVAVGHPREGNWPQKPRLPISRILTTV